MQIRIRARKNKTQPNVCNLMCIMFKATLQKYCMYCSQAAKLCSIRERERDQNISFLKD